MSDMERLPEEYLRYTDTHHISVRVKSTLIVLGIWLAVSLILVLSSLGTIRQNIRRYESMSAVSVDTGYGGVQSENVSVYFVNPQLQMQKYDFSFPSSGRTYYHTLLNALFSGPDSAALSDGAISLIDPNTVLLGFSLSENTAFVSLSSDFLNSADFLSESLYYPKMQIERTLKNTNPEIDNVVVLINGKVEDY